MELIESNEIKHHNLLYIVWDAYKDAYPYI